MFATYPIPFRIGWITYPLKRQLERIEYYHVVQYPRSCLLYSMDNGYVLHILCVVMPLHEWATGSLPPAGRPPTRQVGPSQVHVSVYSTRRSMTSQIDIDCRHYYDDRELGTARPVDINDHQESTERHRQRAVRQTTETPQRLKRVLFS